LKNPSYGMNKNRVRVLKFGEKWFEKTRKVKLDMPGTQNMRFELLHDISHT